MNFADAALVSLVALKLLAAFSLSQVARHCLVDLHVDINLYSAQPAKHRKSVVQVNAGCWFNRRPV